jgi:hypothetical protein
MQKRIYSLLIFGLFSLGAPAQKLAEWTFENIGSAIPSIPISASFRSPDLAGAEGGMSGGNNSGSPTVCSGANAWSTNFWPTASKYSPDAYLYFYIEAKKDLFIDEFSFSCGASSGSSARQYTITYSLGGDDPVEVGGGSMSTGSCGGGGADLGVMVPKGSTLSIRIHPYGQALAAQAATIRIDNVRIGGAEFLPITLASFSAERRGEQGVQLRWRALSAQNVDHVAVERSEDGQRFYEIARIGNVRQTNETQDFVFWDEKPFAPCHYYRLNTVDTDGSTQRSKTLAACDKNPLDQPSPRLYPNPTSERCRIEWPDPFAAGEWQLFDWQGRSIGRVEHGEEVDLSALQGGCYLLRWRQGKRAGALRLVKL